MAEMIKVNSGNGYDYYQDLKGTTYNLVPEGQPAPGGGYGSKEHILKVKGVPDLFIQTVVKETSKKYLKELARIRKFGYGV